MNKKVAAILVCIAMMLGFVVIVVDIVPTVEAPTIYVPLDYTKIQDAINNSIDGDIIYVWAGTYYENIVVNKTLTIIGNGTTNTTIQGNGEGDVVKITVDWVNLTGFAITNSGSAIGDAGLHIDSDYNIILENNISSNNEAGIWLNASSNNIIRNNTLSSNARWGIFLQSSINCIMTGNDISNHSWNGIILDSSSDNNITSNDLSNNYVGIELDTSLNNRIINNNVTSNDTCILLQASSHGNTITGNDLSNAWYGIWLDYSMNNKIINNIISTKEAGIDLGGDSAFCKIIGNNISGNYNGIRIWAGSDYTQVEDNNVSNNEYGIIIYWYSINNTVSNNNVSNNIYGIYLDDTEGNNITGNNVSSNSYCGINLVDSEWNNVTGNNVSDNWFGIRIRYSDDNFVYANNVSDNGFAIYLQFSRRNNVTKNVMTRNGIYIWGQFVDYWDTHEIDTSNTINGKPVIYCKNQIGGTIPPGAGQVIIADCKDVNIKNQELNFGSTGIELGFSSNISITNNNISNNNYGGIFLHYSHRNNINGNNLISNNDKSIEIFYSNENNITGNNMSKNGYGIYVRLSHSNNITGNNICYNYYMGVHFYQSADNNILRSNNVSLNYMAGISLADKAYNNVIEDNILLKNKNQGIVVYLSINNTISRNNISFNKHGIWIGMTNLSNIRNNIIFNNSELGINVYDDSYYNTISGNNVSNNLDGISIYSSYNNSVTKNNVTKNNQYGFYLWSSLNNAIYHNNIIDNPNQAYDDSNKGNKWDNDYPLGGNYWSDYSGVDNFKGPKQDIPGSDGIGDTNYSIDSDSVDNYPLMQPYTPLENYTILKEGWNLISIPLIQQNQSLKNVLEMIDGYYDAIQWYDVTDAIDSWKHYKEDKPYGNDLYKINETMGFWIHITRPGDTIFLYNGTQPTSNQTIILHPGWNLVGYPSQTYYNRTEGLNNLTFGTEIYSIWTYNATTQKWEEIGPSDSFEPCRGYWIYANTKCEWEVPL